MKSKVFQGIAEALLFLNYRKQENEREGKMA